MEYLTSWLKKPTIKRRLQSQCLVRLTGPSKQVVADPMLLEWAFEFAANQIDDQAKRSTWLSSCNGRLSVLTSPASEDTGFATRRFVEVARIRDLVGMVILNGLHESHGRRVGDGGRSTVFTKLVSLLPPALEGQNWRLQVTLDATTGDMISEAERGSYLQDMFTPLLYQDALAVRVDNHLNNIDKILEVEVDFQRGFELNREFFG